MRKVIVYGCILYCFTALGAETRLNFSDFQEGQSPTNFHSVLWGHGAPPAWQIVMDEVPSVFAPLTDKAPVVNRKGVLAQTSNDMTDDRYPMFIYDGDVYKNFKFSTRFKIVSGISEQMAGLVFRFQNASNFYVVRASALGQNLRFYKIVNGEFADPFTLNTNIATGIWHTLTVECEGNQINCTMDDSLKMPLQVPATFATGKIGFFTKSDAVSYFSDATVDYTPLIPAAQGMVNDIMQKESRILGLRIYTLEEKGEPKILASKDQTEIGRTGTDAEKKAINEGTVSFGRGPGTVAVTLPLRDHNGDPVAAVRVQLKSFAGETQESAVTRATIIIHKMQEQVISKEDLLR